MEDLADTRFAQKISQLAGRGAGEYQRRTEAGGPGPRQPHGPGRLWPDPGRPSHRHCSGNVNQAKGSFDGPRQAYIIGANDQLFSSSEYRPLIIAYRNGAPVKLSDVAEAIDDAENVQQAAWMNNTPAVILNIQRQPGANVIEVVDRIKKFLPQLRSSLPPAVQVSMLTDRTTTIRASVRDVQFELMLAVVLVVLVIFLFLRNLSATTIPSVAVPLSLVGTFGVMYLLGFSLNNLSLMALTISTGFVVDDAIVMIENIARFIEAGGKPLEAALKGSKQIGFTILSLTVSLIAVLIPLLFMGDVVGRLFREFAVTLGRHHPHFGGRIADPHAHDVRPPPQAYARGAAGKVLPGVPADVRPDYRVLRQDAEMGARAAKGDPVVAAGTLVLTVVLYHDVPKGFFPVRIQGSSRVFRRPPSRSPFRPWPSISRPYGR